MRNGLTKSRRRISRPATYEALKLRDCSNLVVAELEGHDVGIADQVGKRVALNVVLSELNL